jgi:aerobic-type carbon monoxide dehydrogenase small subunit (CoxS/CutS family)
VAEQLDRNLCRCGSQSRILKAVENYIEKVS